MISFFHNPIGFFGLCVFITFFVTFHGMQALGEKISFICLHAFKVVILCFFFFFSFSYVYVMIFFFSNLVYNNLLMEVRVYSHQLGMIIYTKCIQYKAHCAFITKQFMFNVFINYLLQDRNNIVQHFLLSKLFQ